MRQTAVQAFAGTLSELRRKAGQPTLGALIRQAARQVPPVSLNPSSLSDWLTGKSVPSDRVAVAFLFRHLTVLARRDDPSAPDISWTRLWEEARSEKEAQRGGRPSRPRTVAAEALAARVGRGSPLSELRHEDGCTEWEVHPSVSVPGIAGQMPLYVRRAHDTAVRQVVEQAASGSSGMVVLVGGSSTGKTRACWEAVQELPPGWRLWHPLDPNPVNALTDALKEGVAPRTAIWLNELQRYVGEAAGEGAEQAAAGLRALLQDQGRGPVLVLATVWPEYWTQMSDRPSTGPDLFPQVRELLAGRAVHVPACFDGAAWEDVRAISAHDPRLAEAMEKAAGGLITQYLAGAPTLSDRYRTAPAGAAALVRAAMDLSRLGGVSRAPLPFLEAAVDGYLSDSEYDSLDEDWLEAAFAYARRPYRGVRGLLTEVRARPGAGGRPVHFRLADFLDHAGRQQRRFTAPPASFWQAGRDHLDDPQALLSLARAAHARWRDQDAVLLYQQALDAGDVTSAGRLAWLWQDRGRPEEAARVQRQAALAGDRDALEDCLGTLLDAGDLETAEQLLRETARIGGAAAQLLLARSLADDGQPDEAALWYGKLARCGDAEVLYAYADDLRAQGDRQRACAMLRAAGDGRALRELAFIASEFDTMPEAEEAAREAFAAGESRPLHLLAQKAAAEGRHADAVRHYRHAIAAMERRRQLRQGGQGTLVDLLAGPRPLTDFIDASRLPMPAGETWALRELVAVLDETEGRHAGDAELRRVAEAGNPWALENLIRRLDSRGTGKEGQALLMAKAAEGSPWALWSLAHCARHDGTVSRSAARAVLEEAAAAGVAQAYAALLEEAEEADLAEEADQWALSAAGGDYVEPLHRLVSAREKAGRLDAAEELAWQAAPHQQSWMLRRLAADRSAETALPLLRRAYEAGMPWAPGMIAACLETAGEHEQAESFARIAADAGDREPLENLATSRAHDDPQRTWRSLLAHGLTAQGTTW